MKKFSIQQPATAGTTESSDIQIMIDSSSKGIAIELTSSVQKQYGRQIIALIEKTLKQMGIEDAKIAAVDKGALDCTIVARTITAVHRASGITQEYNWKEMQTWTD